jgi:ribosomal protein S18 acetylase RimI-like enzyme
MSHERYFDNICWHALSGPHVAFAVGTPEVRRYAAGFSPIIGFADPRQPNLATLAPYCASGEHFYCEGWTGPAPAGWRVEKELTTLQMIWEGDAPADDEVADVIQLGPQHAMQALELALLTKPGPFGPRTTELGDYFGVFEGERLVAMAGERMAAGPLREISGVCTHPDFIGRGHARRLVARLVRRQIERGEIPLLHVLRDNVTAFGLYERMGFRVRRESLLRVVARTEGLND